MEKLKIFNIDILNITQEDLLKTLNEGVVVTPNVDHLVKLQNDEEFYNIYKQADWVICDSKIIALGLKFLGTPIKEVIPGSSFFHNYYEYHKDNENIKIFLLGAAKGVAEEAMLKINNKIGRNIIVGAHSPSFGFEKNPNECLDIINTVNHSGANVLLVGVGAPKQEKWIYKYKDDLKNIDLFLPLGATIDFEAGNIKRAPKIFQKLALEWLYRMFKDPKRLIKRYLIDDIPFFFFLIKQKIGKYKNPFNN
ncbi:N-acetylglucosaminyldiphosphoundecaprenol N-acetyl-beta-D-mannosaminyltransferase [Dysgonomonadaceae bacterium PH5-43]|nr:N-acetylglucosaminyldiphosphoundecaprenol N-acetyl-beta-D-mannosaminyltransferase [Dysgonomonadaceae bacterium PH5-43]